MGLSFLLRAPQFRVDSVVLTRSGDFQRVSGTTLQSVASVVGQSVFTISTKQVVSQVASVPGVRRARVLTRLPNIVEIEVEERRPIIVWRTFTGDLLVDDQGFVVRAAVLSPDPLGALLPVVVDTSGTLISVGDRLPARDILAVGAVTAAFEASRLPLEAVEYGANGLSFVIDDGTRVVMGKPDDLNAKFGHMLAVRSLAQEHGLRLATLDVRAPTRPSYRVATPVPVPTGTPFAVATPPRPR
jgi:cell division protein FtsQ